jgi:hypothetical protein
VDALLQPRQHGLQQFCGQARLHVCPCLQESGIGERVRGLLEPWPSASGGLRT